jgi:hypothetical protein
MNIYSHQNQFLDNKYTRWYYAIIVAAQSQNRKKNNGVYYENHHILPKCWFPEFNKESWNQVLLTAREHFICHILLIKMTNNILRHKMVFAANCLLRVNNQQERINITSRYYDYLKIEFSKTMTGRKHTKETKEKISRSSKLQIGPWKGKKRSNEFCKKISEIQKNRIRNPSVGIKISIAKKGKSNGRDGFLMTRETKDKISLANKNKRKGIPWTEARRLAQKNRRK